MTIPAESPTTAQRRFASSLSGLGPRFWPALRDFMVHALAQVRILHKPYAGLMHLLIFWGVTIQVVGTAVNLMQMPLFIPFVELPFPRGRAYLGTELIMDLAGVAILLGVFLAAFRRLVLRPKTLETHRDDLYALLLLALIPVAGFVLEGLRLLAAQPAWAPWSPVGNSLAHLFAAAGMTSATAVSLHPYLFWAHMLLGLLLIASIPFTKLRHLILTPLNIILRPRRREGALTLIEDMEEVEILGVGQVTDFTPQQLLSFDACLRCGRCQEVCPVALSGMPYTPCNFIQSLRQEANHTLLFQNGANGQNAPLLLAGPLPEDAPWFCTTCGACLTHCPAFVDPVQAVIDLRRYQSLTTGKPPRSVINVLRNLERQGNPWGMSPNDRLDWIDSLGIRQITPGGATDVLLFLGCACAYDDRNRKAAHSFMRLLQSAGVDFAILGTEESCCGDTARRLGNEYLFQILAEQNIETLAQVTFNRIVTSCPHCLNTLKNEYPQLGGNYQVQHYTEILAELGPSLPANSGNGAEGYGRVTYHDPCYLCRYNQVYDAPRQLLDQAGVHRIEMPRQGAESFCCGGGGGQMWLESEAETRINNRRLEEALGIEADVIATACPYCLLMFDDAIRSRGLTEQVEVLDVSEILNVPAGAQNKQIRFDVHDQREALS